ncbi:hypothetical protein STANM309S_02366 [Streptomyces tanashiensis]
MRLLRPAGGGPSGGDEDDDAALLRAVARGDTQALAVLYDRHAGWLHARRRRCRRWPGPRGRRPGSSPAWR